MLDKLSNTVQVILFWCHCLYLSIYVYFKCTCYGCFSMLSRHANSPELFNKVHSTSLVMLSFIGFIISTILYFVAPFFYETMFDGKYLASMDNSDLGMVSFIVFSYAVLSNSIVARNGIKHLILINAVMVIINILMNYISIPRFGASGVAPFSTVM